MIRVYRESSLAVELLIGISFFLFSLGSYYFYQVGLCVFQLMGVVLLFPLFKMKFVNAVGKQTFLLVLLFFYFFLSGALLASFSDSQIFDVSKLALPILVLGYLIFSVVVFYIYPHVFQRILFIIITIHVAFFIVQFSWYLTTGTVIDFLEPFTGEVQRVIGGSYELSYLPNFIRTAGLYNEPGTYATWMMVFLFLYKSNAIRLGILSSTFLLEIAVIGTVSLSFSSFGLIFVAIYLISMSVEKGLSTQSIFMLVFFGIIFAFFSFDFLVQRFFESTDDNGLGFRWTAIFMYLNNLDLSRILFGLGMFNDFFIKIDHELVYQDVGLWFTLLSSGGIVGIGMLVVFFSKSIPMRPINIGLLAILLLSKFVLTYAIVWLVLFYIMLYKGKFHISKRVS